MNKFETYWDSFNTELYDKIKKIKMENKEEYHTVSQAETLDKFRRVLMNVFDGDADAMLGELESRMALNEDYETAAQMRDIRKKLNDV